MHVSLFSFLSVSICQSPGRDGFSPLNATPRLASFLLFPSLFRCLPGNPSRRLDSLTVSSIVLAPLEEPQAEQAEQAETATRADRWMAELQSVLASLSQQRAASAYASGLQRFLAIPYSSLLPGLIVRPL